MRYASSLSQQEHSGQAVEAVCQDVLRQLNGQPPDLSFLFVSHHHRAAFETLAASVQKQLQKPHVLLGCAGEFIAGTGLEVEEQPAISLWSAVLPEARLLPFQLSFEQTPDGILSDGWPEQLEEPPADVRAVFLLGEPYSTPVDTIIERLAEALPGVPLIGGMASGARAPGINRLFLNEKAIDSGAAGMILCGGPEVRSVVSQGCRPVGPAYVVTAAEENVIRGLGGETPLKRLQEFFPTLDLRDQMLFRSGPHLGIAMTEYRDKFGLGDFLISNVMGLDSDSGALAVSSLVRVGQTVRFHVRDAGTADEELRGLLEKCRAEILDGAPQAALLFSCNGRGTRLFPEPNHDAGLVKELLGAVPLAGFFANGELGPVGPRNYIHGFTASLAVFH